MMLDDTIQTETLVAYLAGELAEADAGALRARLETDTELREKLDALGRILSHLGEDATCQPSKAAVRHAKRTFGRSRPGLVEQIGSEVTRIVAALVFDSRIAPLAAGVRGVAETVQLTFEADGIEADLELLKLDDETWRLRGAIDADDTEGWSVHIAADGDTEIVVTDADDRGRFKVDLAAGSYQVSLRRKGRLIDLGALQVPG